MSYKTFRAFQVDVAFSSYFNSKFSLSVCWTFCLSLFSSIFQKPSVLSTKGKYFAFVSFSIVVRLLPCKRHISISVLAFELEGTVKLTRFIVNPALFLYSSIQNSFRNSCSFESYPITTVTMRIMQCLVRSQIIPQFPVTRVKQLIAKIQRSYLKARSFPGL